MILFLHRSYGRNIALALSVVTIAGCSKSAGTSVSGHVTYKGNPVSSASLIFYPGTGRAITTVVDPEGNYAANLPAGDYTATVTLSVNLPPGWKEGDPIPPAKVVLPPQYTKRTQTPLKATIAPGSAQTVDFDLK